MNELIDLVVVFELVADLLLLSVALSDVCDVKFKGCD